jgi:hypothetical protein
MTSDAALSQASAEYWSGFHGAALEEEDGESVPEAFVVVRDNGAITVETEHWVSEIYDMADCDYHEGIKVILALNEDGNLVPVEIGKPKPINTDEEYPFYYARAPIMAGKRRAGSVTYTDH